MSFSVTARVDDHTVTATAETAKEAYAKAVEWQVTGKLADISIGDGSKNYSIAEFESMLANFLEE
jgi:phosphopantetheinyl transferase (holo-ACP synthase)